MQVLYDEDLASHIAPAPRGGRLGLNSVSVPLDGFPTDPFHRLPLRGIAQGGRSPTGAMPRNGGEFHAASVTARPAKYT